MGLSRSQKLCRAVLETLKGSSGPCGPAAATNIKAEWKRGDAGLPALSGSDSCTPLSFCYQCDLLDAD